ncbi:hypothetical protein DFH09DRAFT_1357492 [Mycena vulgaris]|nr:hypothetical protein DFH09DRAFT_1357492 [Mycena vulgaris]
MAANNPHCRTGKNVLRRNQACSHCRYRKVRCDARRPICGQCYLADDCEYYTENLGRFKADILEEEIRRVQNRIEQLENPIPTGSPPLLSEPYGNEKVPAQIPGLYRILETPGLISPRLPVLSGPPSVFMKFSPTTPDSSQNADELESLLDVFLVYSADWGFFLDTERFRRGALLPLPLGHPSRPSPVLLAAVDLAGAALSDRTHENMFRERTLSALPTSLSGVHPRKTLHVLQAQVLLANYFFAGGKYIQGMHHTTVAVSLIVGSGLHKLRSDDGCLLWERVDPIEQRELRDACWATFTLDKAWAAVLGTQSNWSHLLEVPWLLEPENSENGSSPLFSLSGSAFLDESGGILSPNTLLARAAMLWERATCLTVCWNPDVGLHQSREFSSAFDSLDERIEGMRDTVLLPAGRSSPSTIFLAHSIVHGAAMQLHTPFASSRAYSGQKCLAAAVAVLNAAANTHPTSPQRPYINPIVAPVWGAACQVAIDEIHRGKRLDSALLAVFERGFAAMRAYAGSCPLMDYHIDKIQNAYL